MSLRYRNLASLQPVLASTLPAIAVETCRRFGATALILCASTSSALGCGKSDDKSDMSGQAEGDRTVPCDAAGAAKRAAWVLQRSSTWSADPEHPESNHDHGLRIAGRCNTALRYQDFACDSASVRKNVHDFSFFIAERTLGFKTVICEEIEGGDTSKRLVEYPIGSAYERGDFVAFMLDGLREYTGMMCKCGSKACAERVRAAYDELSVLEALLPQDAPSKKDNDAVANYHKRYASCESRFLRRPAPPAKNLANVRGAAEAPAPTANTSPPSTARRSSKALPAECSEYAAAVKLAENCDKLPQAKRDAVKQSYEQKTSLWARSPASATNEIALDCRVHADAVSEWARGCGSDAGNAGKVVDPFKSSGEVVDPFKDPAGPTVVDPFE